MIFALFYMLAFLRGKILNKNKDFIIVEVNNIGYQVFITSTLQSALDIAQEIELYLHQHTREDAISLYGFKLFEELKLFKLLLSISGIGPKSALSVLSTAKTEIIIDSIARGDSSLLTKVSGIGKKTAERVVLELNGKLKGQITDNVQQMAVDEIDALVSLGYSIQQAQTALQQVDSKIKDSGERIKAALQQKKNP
ncbi:Holliday junction branch migration protein RuvA [Patescibacteria group bacterium]|nr:Holliday junction branch migration protein RuvA [Patescibacteria group bacterium]